MHQPGFVQFLFPERRQHLCQHIFPIGIIDKSIALGPIPADPLFLSRQILLIRCEICDQQRLQVVLGISVHILAKENRCFLELPVICFHFRHMLIVPR